MELTDDTIAAKTAAMTGRTGEKTGGKTGEIADSESHRGPGDPVHDGGGSGRSCLRGQGWHVDDGVPEAWRLWTRRWTSGSPGSAGRRTEGGGVSSRTALGRGFRDEAAGHGRWPRDRVDEQAGGDGGPLKIMYRIDESSDLAEDVLEHREGYRGSAPVRIGNGAAYQLQLDIHGEAIDSI